MPRRYLILFFTISCISPLLANPCLMILGKLIAKESGIASSESVYELSSGIDTQVVRIVPKNPKFPSRIEKRYYDIGKFMMESMAYEKLAGAIEGPGVATTFKMAKAEPQSNQTIILEDVKGVPLDKALADADINATVKESLKAVYRMKLRALRRLVEARYPEAKFIDFDYLGLPAHNYLVGGNLDRTEMVIKADQVVVTFDPQDPRKFFMTIVDAY